MASKPDSLFARIQDEVKANKFRARSQASRDWFYNRLKNISSISRERVLKDPSLIIRKSPAIGSLNMFFYEARGADTLPYWDKFPLTLVIDYTDNGFRGLNLHYLSPPVRTLLLSRLYDVATNKRFDESTRIKTSYSVLKASQKYRQFKPAYKAYLMEQVRSPFSVVPASDWEIACYLQLEMFIGATKEKVWAESRNLI